MSFQRIAINQVLRFQVKRRFRKNPDVFELRAIMDEMTPLLPATPKDIAIEPLSLGGVAAERLSAAGTDSGAAFLYIHGGGWVAGSPRSHRPLTWRLAKKIGIPVYAIDYRLAPEHLFPAALDDCVAAYRALLAQGIPASRIAVGGDSAGGNLTLALALRLKEEGIALPGALVCLSPATDLTSSGKSIDTNAKRDSMFVREMMHSLEPRYFPGMDPKKPFLSPLFGDVAGLPPTLFQVGDTEMLLDDSTRMAAKMKEAGVAVKLDVWPKVWHVWQVMADRLPEGEKAIDDIAAFVKANLKPVAEPLS